MNMKYLNLPKTTKYVIKKICTFSILLFYKLLLVYHFYRFQRYTESKSYQLAACLIP